MFVKIYNDGTNLLTKGNEIQYICTKELSEEEYNKFKIGFDKGLIYKVKDINSATFEEIFEEYQSINIPDTTKIISELQAKVDTMQRIISSQNDTMETQSKIVNELVLAKLKTV